MTIKKAIITLGILAFHFLSRGQSNGINYQNITTWNDLLSIARSENKPIFIDVYATWCTQCKRMDAETFKKSSVYEYLNSKYISLKVQMDSSKKDDLATQQKYGLTKKILTEYNIKSVPTFLFFTTKGELLHREQGYFSADSLISIFTLAENPQMNFKSWMDKWQNGDLQGKELLNYARKLKDFKYDSLANEVIKSYKKNVLDKLPVTQTLNNETLDLLWLFPSLYSSNDSLIRYIYRNKKEVDRIVNREYFSNYIIESLINREVIVSEIKKAKKTYGEPRWSKLEKKISQQWDPATARNTILTYRVRYYYDKQDWNNVIKYQIQRLDQKINKIGESEAYEFNVFVWEAILKHSSSSRDLKKGKLYMEKVLEAYPEDYSKTDTYANVLYRLGKKSDAIKYESRALMLAKEKKDQRSIKLYEETISRMEKNLPIQID